MPGGFGVRGLDGKLGALTYARTNGIPTLGLCLGLQCMVIEYARNVAGLEKAASTEFDPDCPEPVIATMEEQKSYVEGAGDLGGTMRLGLYPAELLRRLDRPRRRTARPGSRSATVTATRSTTTTASSSGAAGLVFSGTNPDLEPGRVRRAARARCTPTTSPPRRTPSCGRGRPARTRSSPGLVGAAIERQKARAVPDRRVQAPARARGRPLACLRLSPPRPRSRHARPVSSERDDHRLPAVGRAQRRRRARDLRPPGAAGHARWPSWPRRRPRDEDTLHRLLRALGHRSACTTRQDGRCARTPSWARGCAPTYPGILRPLARTLPGPALWAAWGHLGHSVRTGENAFEAVHGVDVWTHRQNHPEENAVFNDNMTALTCRVADAVAEAYDFSGCRRSSTSAAGTGHPAGGGARRGTRT